MKAVATTLETKATHCLPNAQFAISNAADDAGMFKSHKGGGHLDRSQICRLIPYCAMLANK
ncbi:hypothetical protein CV014_04820 [Nostoc sp. CMAA1605]|nr:hypothetical protein [Nostoc sp. CMAA1605]